MKKSTTRIAVIIICLIAIVVGYYAYLSNKSRESRMEGAMTMVQSTLSRDLKNDYPATPKEVIKYYNDILKCFYNEECTDEEIDDLGHKARELYDAELLEQNELGTYLIRLREDIGDFKKNNRRITNMAVAASTSVDFFSQDGFDFARIRSGYDIMDAGANKSSVLVYLLRKDDQKRWKIYGWDLAENVTVAND
ncbi:MAG: DUF6715 family protein [Acetatifactor sp.]